MNADDRRGIEDASHRTPDDGDFMEPPVSGSRAPVQNADQPK
jgi:hypothetical protein